MCEAVLAMLKGGGGYKSFYPDLRERGGGQKVLDLQLYQFVVPPPSN